MPRRLSDAGQGPAQAVEEETDSSNGSGASDGTSDPDAGANAPYRECDDGGDLRFLHDADDTRHEVEDPMRGIVRTPEPSPRLINIHLHHENADDPLGNPRRAGMAHGIRIFRTHEPKHVLYGFGAVIGIASPNGPGKIVRVLQRDGNDDDSAHAQVPQAQAAHSDFLAAVREVHCDGGTTCH